MKVLEYIAGYSQWNVFIEISDGEIVSAYGVDRETGTIEAPSDIVASIIPMAMADYKADEQEQRITSFFDDLAYKTLTGKTE